MLRSLPFLIYKVYSTLMFVLLLFGAFLYFLEL